MLRGVIFDLDGTLVDSRLDFEAMRCEMQLASGIPILEALTHLPPERVAECEEILHRHELEGAERATLLPGARIVIEALHRRGLPLAIATRNSRFITEATLAKLNLPFELVMTRDDGPVKPDPWPVLHACQTWGIDPRETVVIGDYRFDIEAGRAAGAKTVLLIHAADPHLYPNREQADLVLHSLADHEQLLAWLESL
jgi:HAD superfamily hydrolase (TIGR01509 family)